jgi:hypothetical protein
MRRTLITGLLLAGPPPPPSPAIPPPARKYSRRSAASATPWRRVRTASVRRYSAWSAARPAAFQASTTPPTTRSSASPGTPHPRQIPHQSSRDSAGYIDGLRRYPGGSSGRACRLLPRSCCLPLLTGGSASALSLSRPAQASLTLRSAGLLNRLKRPLSRGSSPAGYPTEPLVSYQINRQLSGWNLPPLVIRAFGAHGQSRRFGHQPVTSGLLR